MLVVNTYFPEEGFSVSIFLNRRSLQSQFGRIDCTPIIAASQRRKGRAREQASQGRKK